MRENKRVRGAICALLFLGLVSLGWLWLSGLTRGPSALSLAYFQQNPNGWTLVEEDGETVLSRTMEQPPEYAREYTVLRVTLHGQSGFTATLDGEPLLAAPSTGPSSGVIMCSLPEDYGGKVLTFRWRQDGPLPLYPSAALTTPSQEQAIYYAQASTQVLPAAVSLCLALLTVGLFLLEGALGRFRWPTLLLALGPLSQALYWWGHIPTNAQTSPIGVLLVTWTNPVFCWLPTLFLVFQARRKGPWLAVWAALAAADFGLYALMILGTSWLAGLAPALIPALGKAPVALELTGVGLLLLLALRERKNGGFFRLYAPPLAVAAGAAAVYGAAALWQLPSWSSLSGPLHLFLWCAQGLALAVSLIQFIQDSVRRDGELQALSIRAAMVQEQLAVIEESAEGIREQGHETRHHYAALAVLLREGDLQRAAVYVEDLLERAEQIPGYAYADHPAVNAILTVMLARAKRQGVRTQVRAELPPKLAIPDADLTTLLMNLLENALEANAKAPEGAKRWLNVRIYQEGYYLFVGVENARFAPVELDPETGLCRTTKDGAGHGLGMKAAQTIARSYASELLVELPEGGFSVSTALLLEE